MEDNKKRTTADKKKSTATRSKKKVEKPVETELPQQQIDMNQMFQMFQQFMMAQMNNQQSTVEIKKEEKKKPIIKKNKSYLRKERGDEDVLVRSVAGTVCFKSPKTGVTYNFMENGDEEWLTVDEILQMETASKKYLHEPWLIVEDDEINEILGITKVSESVKTLNNIEEALEEMTIQEIARLLEDATEDYKSTFAGIVLTKIKEGELRDTLLINELGRILEMDFDLYK